MKKTKRFLSAALAAAVFGSMSAYVAHAEGNAPSKVPQGYHGLALTANRNRDIYGVTMTEAELKALPFSEADASVGRTDPGYYAGFYVDALNTEVKGGTASYARAYTYVENLDDETIKNLTYGAGTSKDGQFWPRFIKSHLSPTGRDSTPYLVYAIKATYDGDTNNPMYYYIAVNWKDLPKDFVFDDSENCTGTHTPLPCNICGNAADVEYQSVDKDFPAAFTGKKLTAAELITDHIESVTIKDNEVVVEFDTTYKAIKDIMDSDVLLKESARNGGVDPIYLNIATNIPDTATADDFEWSGGYGWDSATHSDNFNAGHIMLWLNPSNSAKTITFTVGGGEEQTLTINYKYTSSTTGGSGSTTKPSSTTTKPAANPTKNPPTGIALATAPVILAAGAVIVAAKKRK